MLLLCAQALPPNLILEEDRGEIAFWGGKHPPPLIHPACIVPSSV